MSRSGPSITSHPPEDGARFTRLYLQNQDAVAVFDRETRFEEYPDILIQLTLCPDTRNTEYFFGFQFLQRASGGTLVCD